MPVLTAGNTVYTRPVAKVMISIPDALLERIDARASAAGETRSGFLQRLAERELAVDDARQRRRWEEMLEAIGPVDLGGRSAAELIREDRESH
jgi:hypothetical protein